VISDALLFGRLWYDAPDNAIGYAMHSSRSHNAVIRVYDDAGNVIETRKHEGEFKEPQLIPSLSFVLLSLNFGVENAKPLSALLHPNARAVICTRHVLAFGILLHRRFVRHHGNVTAWEDDLYVGK
jgi:hypothetical protein